MSNWWDQAVVALDATSKRWDSNVGTTAEPLKRLRTAVMGPPGTHEPSLGGDPGHEGSRGGLSGGVVNSGYPRSKKSLQITWFKFYVTVNFGPRV